MKVNDAVLNGYEKIATKFHMQDISFRAMAGRIKTVTGIEITPTELMVSMSDEAESMSKATYKKVAKFEKWTIKQAGTVVYELESAARPHIIHMLQLYLLGFATKEVMIRKVAITKQMEREGGGIALPNWEYVIGKIEEHQTPKPRAKKSAAKSKDDNEVLGSRYLPIYEMVALGLNFKKSSSSHHVAVLLDAPTDVKGLKELGKKLVKSEGNGVKFVPQLKTPVADLDKDGTHQLYLVLINPEHDGDEEMETLFSIDLQGNVSVS